MNPVEEIRLQAFIIGNGNHSAAAWGFFFSERPCFPMGGPPFTPTIEWKTNLADQLLDDGGRRRVPDDRAIRQEIPNGDIPGAASIQKRPSNVFGVIP